MEGHAAGCILRNDAALPAHHIALMSKPQEQVTLDSVLIDSIADWLMEQALAETPMVDLVEGCCQRMRAAGIPILRALVSHGTLHPLYEAVWHTWHRENGMGTYQMPHGSMGEAVFQASPFFHMMETGVPFVRRRLTGEEAMLDFPALTDFRDQGGTDYIAAHVPFGRAGENGSTRGIFLSWTSDRPSGFADGDIAALRRIQKRLAVAAKIRIKTEIAQNVLTAYLGADAGAKVLGGNIRRGDTETVHSVIWYSDMRNSTRLAETMAPEDYLATLNSVFEATAGPVIEEGGEVLLLIGDAVLALFPTAKMTEHEAAAAAGRASKEALRRLEALNAERRNGGLPTVSCGIALHVGDLTYGNIGIPQRLQFTAIGPAANQVARIETLTKVLERPLLASAAFARLLDCPWQSVGSHALRGVSDPIEVFAP